jgi:hypothetical protein
VGTGPWIKQTVTSERELDYPDVAVNRAGRFTFSFTRTERGGEAASFGPPLVSSGPLTGPFGPARGPAVNPRYAFNPWAVPVTGGSVLVWQEKTRARAFSTFAPVRAVRVGLDGSVGRTRVLDSSERGFEPHVVSLDSSRALILWNNPSFAAALYQAGQGFNRVAAPRATPTLGGTDFLFNRDLASNGRGVAAATWTQGTRVRISVRRF